MLNRPIHTMNFRSAALFLLCFAWTLTAHAQETAADGSRYVVVETGDTLWTIAAKNGLTLDALLALNGRSRENNVILVGEKITVATAPPPTATPLPTATPPPTATSIPAEPPMPTATVMTVAVPTAEPLPTTIAPGILCVEVFADENRNTSRESGESLVGGEPVTVESADIPQRPLASDGSCYTVTSDLYTVTYQLSDPQFKTASPVRSVQVEPNSREVVVFNRTAVARSASWTLDGMLIPLVGAFALIGLFVAYRSGDIMRSKRW